MAEGIAKKVAPDKFEIFSAGSRPASQVNPSSIAVMKEIGIDISGKKPNGFSGLPQKKFDYVISMGCGDACPYYPAIERIDWKIENLKGKGIEFFRKVRDEIKLKVEELIARIG